MEAVGEGLALEAGDGLLAVHRPGRRCAAERVTGGRPVAEGAGLEVLYDGAARRGVGGAVVGGELLAVEVADEVLGAGAARDAAGVEVDRQHPLGLLRVAVHGQREQVRALPHPAGGAGRAEVAQVGPVLEVRGAVEGDFVLVGEGDRHQPALGGGVPEHLRVAEVVRADVEDRVAGVLGPGGTAVGAVGEGLLLLAGRLLRTGVHGDQGRVLPGPEAGGVVLVQHHAAGEDHFLVVLRNGQRELLPVGQVGADGVAPGHVAPGVAGRVVLEEQVVPALVVDQSVGVVHPVLGRGEVELGPVLLVVEGVGHGWGGGDQAEPGQDGQRGEESAARASRSGHGGSLQACGLRSSRTGTGA